MTCPHCQGAVDPQAGALVGISRLRRSLTPRQPSVCRNTAVSGQCSARRGEQPAGPDECPAAAEQMGALETESADAPSAEAIASGEQAINELRQDA